MARHGALVSATAERQVRRLSRTDQGRVLRAIVALASDPHPAGCRQLAGHGDVFRLRVGRHRVLDSTEKRRLLVLVLKVGHRRDVHR